ncbi:MAG: Lrp/AsnC family transcriptional regulator [Candidatus Nitrosocosmicus sp.]|nr:Lrp/AsnC family transcriptional regulator [Candidatus Nitrosocosmicus sp.]
MNKTIDKIDAKILGLMVLGMTNKQISHNLDLPLSTIQRRTRILLAGGIVTSQVQINYHKFGFKTGLLHIYLKDGNIQEISKNIYDLDGITSVEIHIGNSDILGNVVYKDSNDLLTLITSIKGMNGVERIVWSERVYQTPSKTNGKLISILST